MKNFHWQAALVIGLMFIVIHLLINLLLPIGIVLVIISAILYAQSKMSEPKVKVIKK